tara:strand:+ start:238 stop:1053 length:816 start_codon:yes stop_codon:yes gene_type:complete
MFSILFVLISRTPLFFLKAISFFIYIFARTLKVSHLNITKKNIDHCFGDNKELVNKSFRETMELSLIFPFIWGKKDNYKKLIDPDYLQNKSLENNRPKIFFTLHMGCVDILIFVLSELLDQVNFLYTPVKNKKLERKLLDIRQRQGGKMFPATPNGVKNLYKSFIDKENIVIASDLVPHKQGVYEKFFNKECFCIDLVEKLSNKGTHDLHFIYLTKGKKNKYKLVCKKIKNKITTSEMNALFEEAILTAPELYSWEYKKFKKPRTTSANIY